jgi:hypothetical protein
MCSRFKPLFRRLARTCINKCILFGRESSLHTFNFWSFYQTRILCEIIWTFNLQSDVRSVKTHNESHRSLKRCTSFCFFVIGSLSLATNELQTRPRSDSLGHLKIEQDLFQRKHNFATVIRKLEAKPQHVSTAVVWRIRAQLTTSAFLSESHYRRSIPHLSLDLLDSTCPEPFKSKSFRLSFHATFSSQICAPFSYLAVDAAICEKQSKTHLFFSSSFAFTLGF